jgi:hypothetical protein
MEGAGAAATEGRLAGQPKATKSMLPPAKEEGLPLAPPLLLPPPLLAPPWVELPAYQGLPVELGRRPAATDMPS